jgi:hypothetical protein
MRAAPLPHASKVMSLIPVLRMMAQFHRYAFENRSFD